MSKLNKCRTKLKAIRQNLKLKQADVADAVGMSACYYGMIERGERNPVLEDAKKLADLFGITIDDLFFGDESYNLYSESIVKPTGTE